jgi:hypothetical protein
METLPPLNITFVNAYGAQPTETLKKKEQLELPFTKPLSLPVHRSKFPKDKWEPLGTFQTPHIQQ